LGLEKYYPSSNF